MKTNKDNIYENTKRVDLDYKVRDKVMLNNSAAYEYETPYKVPFLIMKYFTNVTVTLQCGGIQIMHNIHRIKPYKSDTKVQDITPENMYEDINIL